MVISPRSCLRSLPPVSGSHQGRKRPMGERIHWEGGSRTTAEKTHFDRDRAGGTSLLTSGEPLVLESEISGLADLHAFLKYQNYVTRLLIPVLRYACGPLEGFEPRERLTTNCRTSRKGQISDPARWSKARARTIRAVPSGRSFRGQKIDRSSRWLPMTTFRTSSRGIE